MIDLRLRLFIPSPAVAVAMGIPGMTGFGGDNRSFSFDQGTSRAEIFVDVDNSPLTQNPITIKRLAFGQSTSYSMHKLEDVIGKPFWWKNIKRDPFLQLQAPPDAMTTAHLNDSALSVRANLEPGLFGLVPNVKVKFHVSGTNPLEPLAPPINCDLDVSISATGVPLVSYSVTGAHDGFPAYELYLAQRLIYSFDPVTAGTSPLNLVAHGDISVNIPPTALV